MTALVFVVLLVAIASILAYRRRGLCGGSWGWGFECGMREGHKGPCDWDSQL